MGKDATDILCIIDRSGSMSAIRDDAIGGFNSFLERQKKEPGEARMTLVQFDNEYDEVFVDKNISDVPPLNTSTYLPRGTTALFDAVGKAVSSLSARRTKMNESDVSSKVICVIITDGHENSSREYTEPAVKKLIDDKKKELWEFVFVAAGIDQCVAEGIGAGMGVGVNNIFSVSHSARGMSAAYNSIGNAVLSYRMRGSVGDNWKTDDDTPRGAGRRLKKGRSRGGYW